MFRIKILIKRFLRPNGKVDFLYKLNKNVSILDIGCGNHSSKTVKFILPNSNYCGIDIQNYNQTQETISYFDDYLITSSKDFAKSISEINKKFNVVISSHNLEHCEDRLSVLEAIFRIIKPNGLFFLSFPSEKSINFPKRKYMTLNYKDDKTHKYNPPDFDEILKLLKKNNFQILYAERSYKPKILKLIGLITDPISILLKLSLPGVWEKWGFESILISRYKD